MAADSSFAQKRLIDLFGQLQSQALLVVTDPANSLGPDIAAINEAARGLCEVGLSAQAQPLIDMWQQFLEVSFSLAAVSDLRGSSAENLNAELARWGRLLERIPDWESETAVDDWTLMRVGSASRLSEYASKLKCLLASITEAKNVLPETAPASSTGQMTSTIALSADVIEPRLPPVVKAKIADGVVISYFRDHPDSDPTSEQISASVGGIVDAATIRNSRTWKLQQKGKRRSAADAGNADFGDTDESLESLTGQHERGRDRQFLRRKS
jgi:hypothetical protein